MVPCPFGCGPISPNSQDEDLASIFEELRQLGQLFSCELDHISIIALGPQHFTCMATAEVSGTLHKRLSNRSAFLETLWSSGRPDAETIHVFIFSYSADLLKTINAIPVHRYNPLRSVAGQLQGAQRSLPRRQPTARRRIRGLEQISKGDVIPICRQTGHGPRA